MNALCAVAAARHAGVPPNVSATALGTFKNVKRRMELKGVVNDIYVYDDFAHHPSAIATTINGLRNKIGDADLIGVIEPRSNTMKLGHHKHELGQACVEADQIFLSRPDNLSWNLDEILNDFSVPVTAFNNVADIVAQLIETAKPGSHILIMSNGAFDNIHDKLLTALREHYGA
jgi:UDP-N-acetylmuramate: L-alanyl-gamma-D-glutamyl-meso-diaminopimelate ligase